VGLSLFKKQNAAARFIFETELSRKKRFLILSERAREKELKRKQKRLVSLPAKHSAGKK
jgi:hypothetical protein